MGQGNLPPLPMGYKMKEVEAETTETPPLPAGYSISQTQEPAKKKEVSAKEVSEKVVSGVGSLFQNPLMPLSDGQSQAKTKETFDRDAVVAYMRSLGDQEREANRKVAPMNITSPNVLQASKTPFVKNEQIQATRADIDADIKRKFEANEKEAKDVSFHIQTGSTNPKELSDFYEKEYGKAFIRDVLAEIPDVAYTALDKDVFGSEKKWQQISDAINRKNRPVGVELQNQYYYNLDNDLSNSLKGASTERVFVSGGTGGGAATSTTTSLPQIDTNNQDELGAVLQQLKSADVVYGEGGKREDKNDLIRKVEEKLKYLTSVQPIAGEILLLKDKIDQAVISQNIQVDDGKQNGLSDELKKDAASKQHFMLGLNYIRNTNPGKYQQIAKSLNETGRVGDIDYPAIASLGQQIKNEQLFREGAVDPNLIGTETDIKYTSYAQKKAQAAIEIGELLKDRGYKNVRQFSEKQIRSAASAAGIEDQRIINDLVAEEKMLGVDAIPKTGGREAIARGFMQPLKGIQETVQTIGENPTDTYLRTQQYRVGEQKLPSDKGNVWYDALEGFGQFIPQVILTRAIGAPLAGATRTATQLVPRGALTAGQYSNIVNYGGTLASVYLQEYGNAYEDALEKTGDPRTARAMGAINASTAAAFELILPDSKIADKAAGLFRSNYASDIIDILKKGGSPEDLARKGRGVISKFVTETFDIAKQEVKEEVATNITNYLTEAIFSPKTAEDRDLANELVNTAKSTAVSMIIPAVLGGASSSRQKDFTVNTLHSASINFDEYKDILQQSLVYDQINQTQYNDAIKMLSTHRQSIVEAPRESAEGKRLSTTERLEYAYQDTIIKSLKEKMKAVAGDVSKENIQIQINAAEQIQREILMPERMAKEKKAPEQRTVSDETWRKRVMPIEQEEAFENEDVEDLQAEQRPAQTIVDEAVSFADDIKDPNWKSAFLENPAQSLKEVAQQIHGTTSEADGANKTFGTRIADLSLELYPTMESTQQAATDLSQTNDEDLGIPELADKVGAEISPVISRINNADYINEKELETAANRLYDVLDRIDKSDMADEQKNNSKSLVEDLITKIEGYEFATTTKTGTVTEKVPTGRTSKTKVEIKPALQQSEGARVTVTDNEGRESAGVLRIENGNYIVSNENGDKVAALGEVALNNRDLKLPEENPVTLDENGNVQSVSFIIPDGRKVTIQDPEKALDIAIQLHIQEMGEIPDSAFAQVYEEVEKKVPREVLRSGINTSEINSDNISDKSNADLIKRLNELQSLLESNIEDTNGIKRGGQVVNEKQASKIMKYLSKKYGVESALEDMGIFGPYGAFNRMLSTISINKSTTIDKEGNLTAAIEPTGNIYRRTIFHEYLHPFVELLSKNNSALYDEMYQKALEENSANPFADISSYKKSQQKEELVTRYLDRISDMDKPPSVFQKFIDWISGIFYSKRKNDTSTLKSLSKDTTVEQLYDVFKNYGNISSDFQKQYMDALNRTEADMLKRMLKSESLSDEEKSDIQKSIDELESDRQDLSNDKRGEILKEIELIKKELNKRGVHIPSSTPTQNISKTNKNSQNENSKKRDGKESSTGSTEINSINNNDIQYIFASIEAAERSKKSRKAKSAAIDEAVKEFGEKGERAAAIQRNFESIVRQLKENKKLEVIC